MVSTFADIATKRGVTKIVRNDEQVRVRFPVPDREEGFPPVDAEYLWCTPRNDGRFIVDNIPFYTREISLGDVVDVRKERGEELVFNQIVEASSNTTIRVFARSIAYVPELVASLGALGCDIEGGDIEGHLAISAPKTAQLEQLFAFLDRESSKGAVAFEESAVRYK